MILRHVISFSACDSSNILRMLFDFLCLGKKLTATIKKTLNVKYVAVIQVIKAKHYSVAVIHRETVTVCGPKTPHGLRKKVVRDRVCSFKSGQTNMQDKMLTNDQRPLLSLSCMFIWLFCMNEPDYVLFFCSQPREFILGSENLSMDIMFV